MALVFGTVEELQSGKSTFGPEVRLVRMYEVPKFRDRNRVFSMECIFHNKKVIIQFTFTCNLGYKIEIFWVQSQRIHATIQQALISRFKPILKVGDVFADMEFVIGLNKME